MGKHAIRKEMFHQKLKKGADQLFSSILSNACAALRGRRLVFLVDEGN